MYEQNFGLAMGLYPPLCTTWLFYIGAFLKVTSFDLVMKLRRECYEVYCSQKFSKAMCTRFVVLQKCHWQFASEFHFYNVLLGKFFLKMLGKKS